MFQDSLVRRCRVMKFIYRIATSFYKRVGQLIWNSEYDQSRGNDPRWVTEQKWRNDHEGNGSIMTAKKEDRGDPMQLPGRFCSLFVGSLSSKNPWNSDLCRGRSNNARVSPARSSRAPWFTVILARLPRAIDPAARTSFFLSSLR